MGLFEEDWVVFIFFFENLFGLVFVFCFFVLLFICRLVVDFFFVFFGDFCFWGLCIGEEVEEGVGV